MKLLCTTLLLLASFQVNALSFDCTKASTSYEIYICKVDALVQLEEKINIVYREAISVSKTPKELKQSQIAWLKERDKCLKSKVISIESCLLMSYNKRIIQLSSVNLSVDDIAGHYFNMASYCPFPTKDHGFPCDNSWGAITIVKDNISMETVGVNYHTCHFKAKITKIGNYFQAKEFASNQDSLCKVNMYSDGEQLITVVPKGSEKSCARWCGARTRLDRLYANKKTLNK